MGLNVFDLFNSPQSDSKPFTSVQKGKSLLIDMGKSKIWRVPTDQTMTIQGEEYTWAEVAQKLWPCFLRKVGDKYQVTKKIRGKNVHIARVMLGVRDDQMLKFENGDTLDYTADNLYVVSDVSEVLAPLAGRLPYVDELQSMSASPLQDRFEQSTLWRTGWNMEELKFAADEEGQQIRLDKPVRPKGAGNAGGADARARAWDEAQSSTEWGGELANMKKARDGTKAGSGWKAPQD